MKMEKIDKRRHYIIVCDTETANSYDDKNGKTQMDSVLMYDCGWCVMDTKGNVYVERSYVNSDIFVYEKDLMKSAYYANKIPNYWRDIWNGKRKMATTYEIRKQMMEDVAKYGVHEVMAHNARFDKMALNNIQKWTTKSKYRYWFSKDIVFWDTMKMARDVMLKMPTYRRYCEKHGFLTTTGKLSAKAEHLYSFIINDPDFIESHTGLEDVQIEREIFLYCRRQHKKMRKALYEK